MNRSSKSLFCLIADDLFVFEDVGLVLRQLYRVEKKINKPAQIQALGELVGEPVFLR